MVGIDRHGGLVLLVLREYLQSTHRAVKRARVRVYTG
jgi:hypothetical protein